jgi:hypothetical protein
VTLCAVCIMHMETRNMCFLVWPQNQGRWVSRFGPQNRQLRFGDLGLKITVTFFLAWASKPNRQREVDAGHALRSIGLLRVEASWAWISQFDLKTGGGAATDGARDIITNVAWS